MNKFPYINIDDIKSDIINDKFLIDLEEICYKYNTIYDGYYRCFTCKSDLYITSVLTHDRLIKINYSCSLCTHLYWTLWNGEVYLLEEKFPLNMPIPNTFSLYNETK